MIEITDGGRSRSRNRNLMGEQNGQFVQEDDKIVVPLLNLPAHHCHK